VLSKHDKILDDCMRNWFFEYMEKRVGKNPEPLINELRNATK